MVQIYATLTVLSSQYRDALTGRLERLNERGDHGASSVETAVITGVLCVAAVGVGLLIKAAVTKYSASIK